ncbi:MAG: ATP synthase F1 subunit delta [Oscillospiraceae bacterium]
MTGDVGKIYADALFELCSEDNSYEQVHKDLNDCNKVFTDNPDLVRLLSAPTVTADEKVSIIDKIFDGCGIVCNLLCILAEKNRTACIDRITEAFNALYNDYMNIAEMTVTTCVEMNDEMRKKLIDALSKKFGKTVHLTEKVDKSILGGVIVEYGNTQMDNSVKTKLASVHKQLRV